MCAGLQPLGARLRTSRAGPRRWESGLGEIRVGASTCTQEPPCLQRRPARPQPSPTEGPALMLWALVRMGHCVDIHVVNLCRRKRRLDNAKACSFSTNELHSQSCSSTCVVVVLRSVLWSYAQPTLTAHSRRRMKLPARCSSLPFVRWVESACTSCSRGRSSLRSGS